MSDVVLGQTDGSHVVPGPTDSPDVAINLTDRADVLTGPWPGPTDGSEDAPLLPLKTPKKYCRKVVPVSVVVAEALLAAGSIVFASALTVEPHMFFFPALPLHTTTFFLLS